VCGFRAAAEREGRCPEGPAGHERLIVGHTDNQGDIDANLALSQKGAQAVVEALAGKYGIPAARLSARGVSSLAPVSSDAGEEGRVKNRRVEMVVR